MTKPNFIIRAIDNLAFYRGYWADTMTKARRRNPPRMYQEEAIHNMPSTATDSLTGDLLSDEQLQREALLNVWVYSNIQLLSNKSSTATLRVKQWEDDRYIEVPNNSFSKLIARPNRIADITWSYLIRHLIHFLSISNRGAFWYLAPDRKTGEIVEIWPVNSNQIQPIESDTHFVKEYLYTPRRGGSQFKIDAKYIFHMRYPDPHNAWASLPPLRAALLPTSTDDNIQNHKTDFMPVVAPSQCLWYL